MSFFYPASRGHIHTSPPSSPQNASKAGGGSFRSQGGGDQQQQSRSPQNRERNNSKEDSYYERRPASRRDDDASPSKYLSRFNANDEPLLGENPEWVRKSSRQRRFTQSTLPVLHTREQVAREEIDYDETEREQVLGEMTDQMNDMSGFITSVVQKKEEDLKFMAEMFDEEGNPIMRYDEDGNPIPFRDEDGHEMDGWDRYEEDTKKANMVTIDTTKMPIKEGWLWKKGSGNGLLSRTNWTRRYFKFDMFQVITVYYFKNQMPQCSEQRQAETKEMYQRRKKAFFAQQKQHARGYVRLMYATIKIPETPRRHKNLNINPAWEFEVAIPNSRTFVLCAESQEDFEMWTQTIGYITSTIQKARDSLKVKRPPKSVYDEAKRDAALCCTGFGKGLFEAVAGQPVEFFVQGYDFENGMPATRGGLQLTAVLESRDLHYDLPVTDNGDGTYTVTYTPTRVGQYELTVMLDDYDIKGSPFHPHVKPAPVSAPHCVADGAGLFCAVVGATNRFNIHTRNSFNQIVVAKGVPFEVYVVPPLVLCRIDGSRLSPGEEWRPQDNGNGTFSVAYTVDPSHPQLLDKLNRGEHVEGEIHVQLDDHIYHPSFSRSIKGGPFRPVLAASATGAALATAARHAALLLGGQEYNEMISSFNLGQSVAAPRQIQYPPQSQPVPVQAIPRQLVDSFVSDADVMVEDVDENDGDLEEVSSFHLRELKPAAQPQSYRNGNAKQFTNQPSRRYDDSFSSSALQSRANNSFGSEPSRIVGPAASPPSYLPIYRRRSDPDMSDSSMQRSIPRNYQGIPAEERQALDAERDQLLRLRRELQEGMHIMDEQVGRIAVAASGAKSFRNEEAPPPPPPYQYMRTSAPLTQPARQPPGPPPAALRNASPAAPNRQPSSRSPPNGNAPTILPPSRVFDSSVSALFNKHVQPLKRIFRYYATRMEAPGNGGEALVRLPELFRCCTDFDITPTFASRKEVRDAYEQALSMQAQRVDGLDFPTFVDSLGLIAMNSLGKPMFAHLYQTPSSRISVLLGMWGLGDPATFEAVLQREKYTRSTGANSSRAGASAMY